MGSVGPSKEKKRIVEDKSSTPLANESSNARVTVDLVKAEQLIKHNNLTEENIRRRREILKTGRKAEIRKGIDKDERGEISEQIKKSQSKADEKRTTHDRNEEEFNSLSEDPQKQIDLDNEVLNLRSEKIRQRRGTKFERGIAFDDGEQENIVNDDKRQSKDDDIELDFYTQLENCNRKIVDQFEKPKENLKPRNGIKLDRDNSIENDESHGNDTDVYTKGKKLGVRFSSSVEAVEVEEASDPEFLRQRREKLNQRRGTAFEYTHEMGRISFNDSKNRKKGQVNEDLREI